MKTTVMVVAEEVMGVAAEAMEVATEEATEGDLRNICTEDSLTI